MSRSTRSSRRGCGINLFNVLTIFILGVAVLMVLGIVAVAAMPQLIPSTVRQFLPGQATATPEPFPTLIVAVALPTETATLPGDSGSGLAPTWTPMPPETVEAGVSILPTNTRRPTATPSIAPTLPPNTPTPTFTNTPTATPTEGPSPTPSNTPSPFLFTKDNVSPQYLRNTANSAGCSWLGIAGEVLDVAGNPVSAGSYFVHVWDSGIDSRVAVGGAPAYGPSGWEQFVFDQPVVRSYNLQLESVNGTPVSQVYRVNTAASCDQNLVFFTFVQNR